MFENGPLVGTFLYFKKVLLRVKSETSISLEKVPFWNVKNPNLKKVPFFSTKLQKKAFPSGHIQKKEHIIIAWREGPFLSKNIPLSEKGLWESTICCFKKVLLSIKSETSISSEKKQQYYVKLKHPYTERKIRIPFVL